MSVASASSSVFEFTANKSFMIFHTCYYTSVLVPCPGRVREQLLFYGKLNETRLLCIQVSLASQRQVCAHIQQQFLYDLPAADSLRHQKYCRSIPLVWTSRKNHCLGSTQTQHPSLPLKNRIRMWSPKVDCASLPVGGLHVLWKQQMKLFKYVYEFGHDACNGLTEALIQCSWGPVNKTPGPKMYLTRFITTSFSHYYLIVQPKKWASCQNLLRIQDHTEVHSCSPTVEIANA